MNVVLSDSFKADVNRLAKVAAKKKLKRKKLLALPRTLLCKVIYYVSYGICFTLNVFRTLDNRRFFRLEVIKAHKDVSFLFTSLEDSKISEYKREIDLLESCSEGNLTSDYVFTDEEQIVDTLKCVGVSNNDILLLLGS